MAAARGLKWPRDTSTPGVPQSNGLAERWVRSSKEGTAASRLRGGASIQWSRFAGPCFAFHHNMAGKQESPYFKRHGVECNADKIPFLALVDFMPTPKGEDTPHSMGSKVRDGLFLGYHCHAGGKWSGDYYVAEFEHFRINPDITPSDARVHRVSECSLRKGHKEISFPLAEHRLRVRGVISTGQEIADAVESLPQAVVGARQLATVVTQVSGSVGDDFEVQASDDSTKPLDSPLGDAGSSKATKPDSPSLDNRGKGITIGGVSSRRYDGPIRKSQRPPDIDSASWNALSSKDRREIA